MTNQIRPYEPLTSQNAACVTNIDITEHGRRRRPLGERRYVGIVVKTTSVIQCKRKENSHAIRYCRERKLG
jgi:hypothetical protein